MDFGVRYKIVKMYVGKVPTLPRIIIAKSSEAGHNWCHNAFDSSDISKFSIRRFFLKSEVFSFQILPMYEKTATIKIMADYCDNKLPEFEPY